MQLGRVNVDVMLSEITHRQLVEWMAYEDLEPFGPEREDLRNANVVSMIANSVRNPKKRRRPYTLRDWQLYFGDSKPPKSEQTWQQQKSLGRQMFLMFTQQDKVKAREASRPRATIVRRDRRRQ